MRNIVYSKYSNERADKFKIRTDIVEDSEGVKYARKTALTAECNDHIERIYDHYNSLSEIYADNPAVNISGCTKINNGLEFEYIQGETFEKDLDNLLMDNRNSELVERIKQYINTLISTTDKCYFSKNEEFIKVFGNVNLPASLKCSTISNIDLIFSNIIIKEKWNVIDYEWVFPFAVPDNYIIYRAIKIYVEGSSKRSKLKQFGLYSLLEITESEIEEYSKMESNFIKYVMGETIPLYSLYNQIQKNNIDINRILSEKNREMCENFTQIFYNYGDGFNEKDSYNIGNSVDEQKNIIEIEIGSNVKELRIDPGNKESIVYIESVAAQSKSYYSIDYYNNGLNLNDNTILFHHNDPQIIFPNIKEGTNKIRIEFRIEKISKEAVVNLCKYINQQKEESKIKLDEKERLLEESRQNVYEKNNLLEEYKQKIYGKDKLLEEKDKLLNANSIEIYEKEKVIESYENDLIKIKSSLGWKIISFLHKIKNKL